MDPFSAEGELVNIHTAFIQGQHALVLSDYSPSDFSQSNKLPVRILQLRSQIELGQASQVLSSISPAEASSTPDLAAARTYALFSSSRNETEKEKAVAEAEKLSEAQGENLTVQLLCGTVLARAGKAEQALLLLGRHQGSLDAVALAVQIHLSQNRTDLAVKEAKSARSLGQDALLVNLAESWVGVRQGGENYQKSFYVFEELAQAPSSASATSLIAQAVSELHMGRLEEAETALDQALALEPENSTAIANKFVLDTIAGKDASEARSKLQSVDAGSEILADLAAKREAFQAAMAKYNPKFEP